MTKKEKEHKIKLICLILLVNTEYARRKPFKNIWETIAFASEQLYWAIELRRVQATKTFEKGCVVVSENKLPEIVIRNKK